MSRTNIVEAMESFGDLKHAVHRTMVPLRRYYDISDQQMRILWLIAKHKDGMTTTEIAEIAYVTPGAISQLIDQLVDKGFLRRQASTSDRRVIIISIAPEAEERMATLRTAQRKLLDNVFGCLSDEELSMFSAVLKKIGHHAKMTIHNQEKNVHE